MRLIQYLIKTNTQAYSIGTAIALYKDGKQLSEYYQYLRLF